MESISIADLDLLGWLKEQPIFPKVYWRERGNGLELAGVGTAQVFEEVPQFPKNSDPRLRFYGGMSFSSHSNDPVWKNFPHTYFFLPAFEIIRYKGRCTLNIHAPELRDKLIFNASPFQPLAKKWLHRTDLPRFEDWHSNINSCLASKEFQKVVLARRTSLEFKEKLEPFDILHTVKTNAQNAIAFAFQLDPSAAFIGATPEILYRRENSAIRAEALAGTRPRGKTHAEDLKLKKELLHSDKEQREFQFVKRFIQGTLAPLCADLQEDKADHVIPVGRVQHLCHKFKGTLHSSVSDKELIAALHPTPAIGGFPRDKALELIAGSETFQRGWYAAPIGWITPHAADIAVGIRSALIKENLMHLFAGTGIVAGSQPEKEWEELEHKIGQYFV